MNPSAGAMYSDASDEPLEIIRHNECESQLGSLCTSRFRRLFNEIDRRDRNARLLVEALEQMIDTVEVSEQDTVGWDDRLALKIDTARAALKAWKRE